MQQPISRISYSPRQFWKLNNGREMTRSNPGSLVPGFGASGRSWVGFRMGLVDHRLCVLPTGVPELLCAFVAAAVFVSSGFWSAGFPEVLYTVSESGCAGPLGSNLNN